MASTVDAAAAPLIDRVPLAVCGAGLGLVGLGNAWLTAAERFGAPASVAQGLALLGLAGAALLAAVLALMVATLLPTCLRSVFSLAWWALTFPLAALTIAVLTYADLYGGTIGTVAALALLAGTTALVAWVLARSLAALRAGTLFPA